MRGRQHRNGDEKDRLRGHAARPAGWSRPDLAWLSRVTFAPLGRRTPGLPRLTPALITGGTVLLTGTVLLWWHPDTPLLRGAAGYGHGRGMSQVGAFDSAVQGWTAEHILDHYYPGAALGTVPDVPVRVRLMGRDGSALDTYAEAGLRVAGRMLNPDQAAHLTALPDGRANVVVTVGCDGDTVWQATTDDPWAYPMDPGPGRPAVEHLKLCGGGEYRGALGVAMDNGEARTVNQVAVEDYLLGVVPAEVLANWADQGGVEALRAQAIAARSYALAEQRYSYAQTCDTDDCQMYPGTAKEDARSAAAVAATAGTVLLREGRILRSEYSAAPDGGSPADIGTFAVGPTPGELAGREVPSGTPDPRSGIESPIEVEYRRIGGPNSSVGTPLGPEMSLPGHAGLYRLFTNGVIIATPTLGAQVVDFSTLLQLIPDAQGDPSGRSVPGRTTPTPEPAAPQAVPPQPDSAPQPAAPDAGPGSTPQLSATAPAVGTPNTGPAPQAAATPDTGSDAPQPPATAPAVDTPNTGPAAQPAATPDTGSDVTAQPPAPAVGTPNTDPAAAPNAGYDTTAQPPVAAPAVGTPNTGPAPQAAAAPNTGSNSSPQLPAATPPVGAPNTGPATQSATAPQAGLNAAPKSTTAPSVGTSPNAVVDPRSGAISPTTAAAPPPRAKPNAGPAQSAPTPSAAPGSAALPPLATSPNAGSAPRSGSVPPVVPGPVTAPRPNAPISPGSTAAQPNSIRPGESAPGQRGSASPGSAAPGAGNVGVAPTGHPGAQTPPTQPGPAAAPEPPAAQPDSPQSDEATAPEPSADAPAQSDTADSAIEPVSVRLGPATLGANAPTGLSTSGSVAPHDVPARPSASSDSVSDHAATRSGSLPSATVTAPDEQKPADSSLTTEGAVPQQDSFQRDEVPTPGAIADQSAPAKATPERDAPQDRSSSQPGTVAPSTASTPTPPPTPGVAIPSGHTTNR
ncbi:MULTISPECIES: SpoIID/LytB domain-containing protein [unclassified Nocardia]|uniref:SpoIID/LytB domain-containing protein n=1 Tax=unclassified Nocardia TaxID=2637762 RepID=UPI001CE43011|nr:MULTISPECIES: SpoIID/LytB domain-containing protein [unclassified Nocardia]